MQRYSKKPVSKGGQEINRRVQTEAGDSEDLDLQQAIQKFKNLSDKSKTPQKNLIRNKSKSPTPQINQNYASYTYVNQKIVGQGSFGVVYKSRVNETGEVVAIKKVLQDKRYKNRELQILQELEHTNCVQLKHAFYTQGDSPDETFLNVIMDYMSESLASLNLSYLKQSLLLPDILIKLYAYQLLRSIGYIHSKGICHRDIKPHNVLINPITNQLKLCDFGSAKKLNPAEPNISYICSRCYRAPELIFGATEYTTQIDVWSVGCVIAELMLGQPIFHGDSAVDQLFQIIKILGTPSAEQVISMNNNYDLKLLKIIQIKKQDWKKVFSSTLDFQAIDLISKLLVYSPETRLTAQQALCHSYFDDLRDENTLKQFQFKQIPVPDLFDFTKEELNRDNIFINKLIPKWYMRKKN